MRANEEWAAPGRFVASAYGATPAISKAFRGYGWVLIAVFISPVVFYATTVRNLPGGKMAIPAACVAVMMLASLIPFLNWIRHRNVVICATGDGLTADRRRGVVFPTAMRRWACGIWVVWRHHDGYGPAHAKWPPPIRSRGKRSSHRRPRADDLPRPGQQKAPDTIARGLRNWCPPSLVRSAWQS
jgi:hypothetical protein